MLYIKQAMGHTAERKVKSDCLLPYNSRNYMMDCFLFLYVLTYPKTCQQIFKFLRMGHRHPFVPKRKIFPKIIL